MRIAVVDVPAENIGALSVLEEFYKCVKTQGTEHEWFFFLSTPKLKECTHITVFNYPWIKKSWLHRLWWELLLAGRKINAIKPDLVFSLQNIAITNVDAKQVLYLHLSIPFQSQKKFSFFKKEERLLAVYQYIIGDLIKKSIKRVDLVITQTETMKKEVMKKIPNTSKKILVIPPRENIEGISKVDYKDGERRILNKFFYPASAFIYKNHEVIINAVRLLKAKGIDDFEVILTITSDENLYSKKISHLAKGMEENIKFTGYLKREEILHMYQNFVLIMPSYIESFGIPILEGMSARAIILANNCDGFKEILGNYPNARFFNPFDHELLAQLMEDCIIGKFSYKTFENDYSSLTYEYTGWEGLIQVLAKQNIR